MPVRSSLIDVVVEGSDCCRLPFVKMDDIGLEMVYEEEFEGRATEIEEAVDIVLSNAVGQ